VTDGENGYLVGEGDYHALADRILHLAQHPELLPAMSEQSRREAARYDSALLVERQIDAYVEVAARHGVT
jgi:glycosyltransferase involved in cell wall biosynthesis